MVEYPHALRVEGRFQLVALTTSPVYNPADVVGYAVIDSDGTRLTDVVSLEQAHAYWLQLLEEEKAVRLSDDTTETRPLPRRRRR
jgi:hypothetical protein